MCKHDFKWAQHIVMSLSHPHVHQDHRQGFWPCQACFFTTFLQFLFQKSIELFNRPPTGWMICTVYFYIYSQAQTNLEKIALFTKWEPLSLEIFPGNPQRGIISVSNAFATVALFACFVGNTSTHLLHISTIVGQNLFSSEGAS